MIEVDSAYLGGGKEVERIGMRPKSACAMMRPCMPLHTMRGQLQCACTSVQGAVRQGAVDEGAMQQHRYCCVTVVVSANNDLQPTMSNDATSSASK